MYNGGATNKGTPLRTQHAVSDRKKPVRERERKTVRTLHKHSLTNMLDRASPRSHCRVFILKNAKTQPTWDEREWPWMTDSSHCRTRWVFTMETIKSNNTKLQRPNNACKQHILAFGLNDGCVFSFSSSAKFMFLLPKKRLYYVQATSVCSFICYSGLRTASLLHRKVKKIPGSNIRVCATIFCSSQHAFVSTIIAVLLRGVGRGEVQRTNVVLSSIPFYFTHKLVRAIYSEVSPRCTTTGLPS